MKLEELLNTIKHDTKTRTILIILVVIIALAIAGVIVWKCTDIKDLIIDKKANEKLINEANQTIEVSDITITQDQFETYSSKLYKAMKGWGTNEKAIYAVFQEMNSRSDVQQLIKTFGTKDGDTLREWLYDDLSEDEIAHINSILASKSINYKF